MGIIQTNSAAFSNLNYIFVQFLRNMFYLNIFSTESNRKLPFLLSTYTYCTMYNVHQCASWLLNIGIVNNN